MTCSCCVSLVLLDTETRLFYCVMLCVVIDESLFCDPLKKLHGNDPPRAQIKMSTDEKAVSWRRLSTSSRHHFLQDGKTSNRENVETFLEHFFCIFLHTHTVLPGTRHTHKN